MEKLRFLWVNSSPTSPTWKRWYTVAQMSLLLLPGPPAASYATRKTVWGCSHLPSATFSVPQTPLAGWIPSLSKLYWEQPAPSSLWAGGRAPSLSLWGQDFLAHEGTFNDWHIEACQYTFVEWISEGGRKRGKEGEKRLICCYPCEKRERTRRASPKDDSAMDSKLEQCECSEGRRKGRGQSGLWEPALNAMLKNLVLRWKAFKWLRNVMMFVESQRVEGSELVKRLIVI